MGTRFASKTGCLFLAQLSSLWYSEDDSGTEAQSILDVYCFIGKLCPQPVCLEDANTEVTRESKIDAATHLKGQCRSGGL